MKKVYKAIKLIQASKMKTKNKKDLLKKYKKKNK